MVKIVPWETSQRLRAADLPVTSYAGVMVFLHLTKQLNRGSARPEGAASARSATVRRGVANRPTRGRGPPL